MDESSPSCHSQAWAGPADSSCPAPALAYAVVALPSAPVVAAACAGPPCAAAAHAASQARRWSRRCSGTSDDALAALERRHTCRMHTFCHGPAAEVG